jgi:hypothetical protein
MSSGLSLDALALEVFVKGNVPRQPPERTPELQKETQKETQKEAFGSATEATSAVTPPLKDKKGKDQRLADLPSAVSTAVPGTDSPPETDADSAKNSAENADAPTAEELPEPATETGEKAAAKAERRRRKKGEAGAKEWFYTEDMYKRRFCAYYPDVDQCKRGSNCAFAHSRAEYRGSLLPVDEEHEGWHSGDFYMNHFKTLWCPIRTHHDWLTCVYAHNYLDIRRRPAIGYGPKACPHWDKKTHQTTYDGGCPNGFRCPYAHGTKEQMYHPAYFKTILCRDMMCPEGCPRSYACAFYHTDEESRVEVAKAMEFDYTKPLDDEQIEKLQEDFRFPRPIVSDFAERGGKPARSLRKKKAMVAPPAQASMVNQAGNLPLSNPAIHPNVPTPMQPMQPQAVMVMVPVPISAAGAMSSFAMQSQMMAMQYQTAMAMQSQYAMAMQAQMMPMQAQQMSHDRHRPEPISSVTVVNVEKLEKIETEH